MVFAEWLARLGAQEKTCVIAMDRDANPDARLLARVRSSVIALGASTLVVVTKRALYAFAVDSDEAARKVELETRVDDERRVLLVDRHGALRFSHDAIDALTLASAIEDCADRAPSDVRVSRRLRVAARHEENG